MSAVLRVSNPNELALQLHQAQRAVEMYPGMTSVQLVEITGADREVLLDRLYALQRAGHVHTAEITTCRSTGKLASVWRPGRDPMLAKRDEETPKLPLELVAGYNVAMDRLAPPTDPTTEADAAA